jgi:pantoate kinase
MVKAQAYCPASISLLFKRCLNDNIALTGSVGIGFTANKGVTAKVEQSDANEIFFNSQKINFPTVTDTIIMLTKHKVRVLLTSSLPLGYGFGLSGGSSLSTAYAVNKLFNLGKTNEELALTSHTAEIKNHTGLGTVGTQSTGGFLVKTVPGLPVHAITVELIGQKIKAIVIDRLLTSGVLKSKNILNKVSLAADAILSNVLKQPKMTLNDYLDLSFEFVKQADLIQNEKVNSIIKQIKKDGGHATMAILGNVVLTTSEYLNFPFPTHSLTVVNDRIKLL